MNELLAALVQLGIIDRTTADRITRNLDPQQAQAWAEGVMFDNFAAALDGQRSRLLDMLDATNGRPTAAQLDAFWRAEDDAFFANVQRGLYDVAQERAITSIVSTGAFDMWELVNQTVIDWVNDYYTNLDVELVGSIPNLNATGRTEFARALLDWQRGELETAGYADGLPQLIRAIEPTFGQVRAERVAVTETTRIHYEATYQAAQANPYTTHLRWYSAADDRVCPTCGPNHLVAIPKAQRVWPNGASVPAHVNCRCSVIEETALTMQTALPPEERYVWSDETYANYQAEQALNRRAPNLVDTLVGRP